MQLDETRNETSAVYWLGADVSKKTFDIALARPGQKYPVTSLSELPLRTFERTAQGVCQFLHWLDEQLEVEDSAAQAHVVMESTGNYSKELAVWMLAERPSLRPAIVNAYQTSAFIKSLLLRNKTDGLEARALAFYGIEREPVAYVPLTPEQATLRDLSRHRDALVRHKVAASNRSNEGTSTHFVDQSQQRVNKMLEREIKKTEEKMKQVVTKSPELKHDIEHLTTIYGVAFLTASVIFAELGDLRRFDRARQLTAFTGLSPRIIQSGTSIHRRTRLCKQGNARARQALYMAAVTAVRGDNDLRRTYLRLIEQGKPKKVALGAIMRKLLIIMRAILISGKHYDPNWEISGKTLEKTAR